MSVVNCRGAGGFAFPEVDPAIREIILGTDFNSLEAPTYVSSMLGSRFMVNGRMKYYFAVSRDESLTGGYCVAWGVYSKNGSNGIFKILVWLNGRD
jgi:hypothetical protein